MKKRPSSRVLSLKNGLFLPTNAIFDTGCIGLQSCIEMQPKKCMQPTDKLEFVDYIGVPTSIKLPG